MQHEIIDFDFAVQLSGFLLKKSEQTNKWQNKFIILKDNYLLWYKDDEFAKMKKAKYFNMKPQGIIFLNDCIIREYNDSSQSLCFIIEHIAFQKPQIFSAESDIIREMWLQQLSFNSNLNYQNMIETQRFIKELMDTSSSVKYAKVKQEYNEAMDENENLLKAKKDLEEENYEKQKNLLELQTEFSKLKEELDDAYSVLNNIQSSRQNLELKNTELEDDLKRLELEHSETSEMVAKHSGRDDAIEELKKKLNEISLQKEKVDHEKKEVLRKLNEKEFVFSQLEEENQKIVNQAQELNTCINNLKNYSSDMEKKLQMETNARKEAERRLQEAEKSLGRLHSNIVEGGTKYTVEMKNEMKTDVNKLKDYFENIICSQKSPASPSPTNNSVVLRRTSKTISTSSDSTDDANKKNKPPNILITKETNDVFSVFSPLTFDSKQTAFMRQQSQKIREQHKQRISQIHLDD